MNKELKFFFLLRFILWTINLVLSHILQQTFASEKEISSLIRFCHSEYAVTPNILYLELWPTLHRAIYNPAKKGTKWLRHGDGAPTVRLPNLCERLAGAKYYCSWPA